MSTTTAITLDAIRASVSQSLRFQDAANFEAARMSVEAARELIDEMLDDEETPRGVRVCVTGLLKGDEGRESKLDALAAMDMLLTCRLD